MLFWHYFERKVLWLDNIDQPVAQCFYFTLKNPQSRFRTLYLGSKISAQSMNMLTDALIHSCCKIQTIIFQSMAHEMYQLLFTALRQVPGKYQFYFEEEPEEWMNKFKAISSLYQEADLACYYEKSRQIVFKVTTDGFNQKYLSSHLEKVLFNLKQKIFLSSAHPIFPGPVPLSSMLLSTVSENIPPKLNFIVAPFTYIPISSKQ